MVISTYLIILMLNILHGIVIFKFYFRNVCNIFLFSLKKYNIFNGYEYFLLLILISCFLCAYINKDKKVK